jgi:hypothetical protein
MSNSSLAKKLNLKDGMPIRVAGKPANVDLDDVKVTTSATAEAAIAFVRKSSEIRTKGAAVLKAAKRDQIAWIAYPRGRQLGTDLNRDILWKHMKRFGVTAVRLVSIDNVWAAMRFRPPGKIKRRG